MCQAYNVLCLRTRLCISHMMPSTKTQKVTCVANIGGKKDLYWMLHYLKFLNQCPWHVICHFGYDKMLKIQYLFTSLFSNTHTQKNIFLKRFSGHTFLLYTTKITRLRSPSSYMGCAIMTKNVWLMPDNDFLTPVYLTLLEDSNIIVWHLILWLIQIIAESRENNRKTRQKLQAYEAACILKTLNK